MKDYYWRVATYGGRAIELTVDFLNIESAGDCAKDFLKVFDGLNARATLLKTYCGDFQKDEATVTSSRNYVYLHFRADDERDGGGFKITWKAVIPVKTISGSAARETTVRKTVRTTVSRVTIEKSTITNKDVSIATPVDITPRPIATTLTPGSTHGQSIVASTSYTSSATTTGERTTKDGALSTVTPAGGTSRIAPRYATVKTSTFGNDTTGVISRTTAAAEIRPINAEPEGIKRQYWSINIVNVTNVIRKLITNNNVQLTAVAFIIPFVSKS